MCTRRQSIAISARPASATYSGVTANSLLLGWVDTDRGSIVSQQGRELLSRMSSAGRPGMPRDIADAVALLAQPSAGWINGAEIPVTGGLNYAINLHRYFQ